MGAICCLNRKVNFNGFTQENGEYMNSLNKYDTVTPKVYLLLLIDFQTSFSILKN